MLVALSPGSTPTHEKKNSRMGGESGDETRMFELLTLCFSLPYVGSLWILSVVVLREAEGHSQRMEVSTKQMAFPPK